MRCYAIVRITIYTWMPQCDKYCHCLYVLRLRDIWKAETPYMSQTIHYNGGSSSLTSSVNITKRLIHRDLVVRLSSLFCSQSIISQHCSEQHLSSVSTIPRTTILCRIMAHSISTRHEDPALLVSRTSIRVNWNSHRCRCPSGGINTEIESENVIRHLVVGELACHAQHRK